MRSLSERIPCLDHCLAPRARRASPFAASLIGLLLGGCASPFEAIRPSLAREARIALLQERPPRFPNESDADGDEEPPSVQRHGSVFVGELLAIFPGILWHGLGHRYAGDTDTANRISDCGQWGYLFLAIGAGTLVGAHYLDHEDFPAQNYALPLYVAGGVTSGIGIGFFLTAWIYDLIDTPRAVRTGGEPPPEGSIFRRELKGFDGR